MTQLPKSFDPTSLPAFVPDCVPHEAPEAQCLDLTFAVDRFASLQRHQTNSRCAGTLTEMVIRSMRSSRIMASGSENQRSAPKASAASRARCSWLVATAASFRPGRPLIAGTATPSPSSCSRLHRLRPSQVDPLTPRLGDRDKAVIGASIAVLASDFLALGLPATSVYGPGSTAMLEMTRWKGFFG